MKRGLFYMRTYNIPIDSGFDLYKTLECGQSFRWKQINKNRFIGTINNYLVDIQQNNDRLTVNSHLNSKEICKYFDLNRNYREIANKLQSLDKFMSKIIDFSYGIHILKQEKLECLISFIMSANNNIPRIKKILERLCIKYGTHIEYLGQEYHTFPEIKVLASVKNLDFLKSGWRAKYILDLIKYIDLTYLNELNSLSTIELKDKLMNINGVGDKISDCVLLYSFSRFEVFPTDVWIKRAMCSIYGTKKSEIATFAKNYFGSYRGIAQQYLYYYIMCHRSQFIVNDRD